MAAIDVLIPTCDRPTALAVTLATLLAQDFSDFDLVIADQSAATPGYDDPSVRAVLRVFEARGHRIDLSTNLPRRGMAQQRAFLLGRARAPHVLCLDDDVILEPDLVGRMLRALERSECGFIACGLHGLSFRHEQRPHQQAIEFWEGGVRPEVVLPGGPAWPRHLLHNAANLWHVQSRLRADAATPRLYKLAWSGGCVLYRTAALKDAGGFDFWCELPAGHCGEDVLAQLRVMARHGGAGLLPSGAYHQELPTTVTARAVDAPFHLNPFGPADAADAAPPPGTGAAHAA